MRKKIYDVTDNGGGIADVEMNPRDVLNYGMLAGPVETNPRGTIIPFMGKTAPDGYLACDGTIYNIDEYPDLAQFFTEQFEICNFFGGDGETTFAVPDLKGEFLRGTGTSVRTEGGAGAAVGVHQNPTQHTIHGIASISSAIRLCVGIATYANRNWDAQSSTTGKAATCFASNTTGSYNPLFIARPTNTAVLYCIKL